MEGPLEVAEQVPKEVHRHFVSELADIHELAKGPFPHEGNHAEPQEKHFLEQELDRLHQKVEQSRSGRSSHKTQKEHEPNEQAQANVDRELFITLPAQTQMVTEKDKDGESQEHGGQKRVGRAGRVMAGS